MPGDGVAGAWAWAMTALARSTDTATAIERSLHLRAPAMRVVPFFARIMAELLLGATILV